MVNVTEFRVRVSVIKFRGCVSGVVLLSLRLRFRVCGCRFS